MDEPKDNPSLERAIAGALRATIKDHGPITPELIGGAVKRIIGQLANARLTGLAKAMGRRGGEAGTGDAKRRSTRHYSKAGTNAWAGMSAEERTAIMKRRAEVRKERASARG